MYVSWSYLLTKANSSHPNDARTQTALLRSRIPANHSHVKHAIKKRSAKIVHIGMARTIKARVLFKSGEPGIAYPLIKRSFELPRRHFSEQVQLYRALIDVVPEPVASDLIQPVDYIIHSVVEIITTVLM